MPNPFSNRPTVSPKALASSHVPRILNESRLNNTRQNLDISMDNSFFSVSTKGCKKINYPLFSAKAGESLKKHAFDMKPVNVPAMNLSLSISMATEPDAKTPNQGEIGIPSFLFASYNKVKKERSASVSLKAKYDAIKKRHADSPKSPMIEKERPSSNMDSLKRDKSRMSLSFNSKIDEERQKENGKIRVAKRRYLNFETEPNEIRINTDSLDVSVDIGVLEASDDNIKNKSKDVAKRITLDRLKFKPRAKKEYINLSELINKFSNGKRKI